MADQHAGPGKGVRGEQGPWKAVPEGDCSGRGALWKLDGDEETSLGRGLNPVRQKKPPNQKDM